MQRELWSRPLVTQTYNAPIQPSHRMIHSVNVRCNCGYVLIYDAKKGLCYDTSFLVGDTNW